MNKITNTIRIQNMINVVLKVAQGDYSVQVELSKNNDDFDALGLGLNMMIDDLRNNVDLEKQNKKIKAINSELRKAKEKAQESDRLKSAFLSNMSHEIRSPMNAIMGFSALLGRNKVSPEKSKEYYKYIQNAGKQLLALINDIIDVSKIESNQLKVHNRSCNLNNLLDEVYEFALQDKKLKINSDVRLLLNNKGLENCYINTDPVRFKQIFLNLIGNGIKFTEKGFVEFGILSKSIENQKYLTLYVKDTGVGIPKDMQDVIFQRFRQIHLDKMQEGTGLGLSITKGLIELLNGEIWLESDLDKGTVFYMNFPFTLLNSTELNKNEKEKEKVERWNDIDISGHTIYIAEDKLDSYQYLFDILEPYNLEIKHANNGEELFVLINKKVPDLVLLDMHMPVMDGYKTIERIRKEDYNFPVIAQTAYAMADEQLKIIKSGCDGYLSKPIDAEELLLEIKKQLKL